MGKFIIECPKCHTILEARTGFLAPRHCECACGYSIDLKSETVTTRICAHCGNSVIYDQRLGTGAICPVCKKSIVTEEHFQNMVHFQCCQCGGQLQAPKTAAELICPLCQAKNDVQKQMYLQQERKSEKPSEIRCDDIGSQLVWRHPLTDFPCGTQIIVQESQRAIFLCDGEIVEVLSPGRYTLDRENHSIAQKLRLLLEGSQSLHTEVYFVSLKAQMSLKWGTSSKIGVFDPASGLHVELGASGTFNMHVIEPTRLLRSLAVGGASLDRAALSGDGGYFRSLIITEVKTRLAQIIKTRNISILELDENLAGISAALCESINLGLLDYGLELTAFHVVSIVLPEEDPNFRRLRQQHADRYLRVREEHILREEAQAAAERKTIEAQTAVRMRLIDAQGDAEITRIKAEAEAQAYRARAAAEASEMQMKGYTYQQETARQVAVGAMNSGNGIAGTAMGDVLKMGAGLDMVTGYVDMVRNASPASAGAQPAAPEAWNCVCGQQGIRSRFCPDCGAPRPVEDAGWTCSGCGKAGIRSLFCPDCGRQKNA